MRRKSLGRKTNVFLPLVSRRRVEPRSAALAGKKASQEICVMNGGNVMGFLPISSNVGCRLVILGLSQKIRAVSQAMWAGQSPPSQPIRFRNCR